MVTYNEEHDCVTCTKCGEDIDAAGESLTDFQAAVAEHTSACPGPKYRGKLADCPFCGSKDVDPEGWTSGGCRCPDAAAHAIVQCETRTGPSCDDCGATAESAERWNMRVANAGGA